MSSVLFTASLLAASPGMGRLGEPRRHRRERLVWNLAGPEPEAGSDSKVELT